MHYCFFPKLVLLVCKMSLNTDLPDAKGKGEEREEEQEVVVVGVAGGGGRGPPAPLSGLDK